MTFLQLYGTLVGLFLLIVLRNKLDSLATTIATDCIIEALGNPSKERLKHEDTNISQWLQGRTK